MTRPVLLVLFIVLAGCRAQALDQLPTRAVLPSPVPSLAPARALQFWQPAEGDLAAVGQVDQWQFSALAGDPIQINALGSLQMSLYGPDEALIASGDTLQATLPVNGRYRLAVSGPVGPYQLGLAYSDRPNPASYTATPPPMTIGVPTPTAVFSNLGLFIRVLQAGDITTETFLASPVQPHVYTFAGRAGEYVTVSMDRVSGAVDPALTLFDPSGRALAVDNSSGGAGDALLRNIPLSQDGEYSILADGGNTAGEYRLSLIGGERPVPVTPTIIVPPTRTPAPLIADHPLAHALPDQALTPYTPVIGTLARAADVQRHSVTANEGDFITINVHRLLPDSGLRPTLEVYGPDGSLVNAQNASTDGSAQLSLLPISESGTYSVFVTADSSGDYVIAYGLGPYYEQVPRGPAAADTPYDSQISQKGARDVWTVPLNMGDSLTIAASPLNAALDPQLEVFAPDGSLVASDDNGGGYPNALINEARASVGGEYQIVVSASGGASAGPYRLVWRYINIAPTPTYDAPRILLFSVDDFVQVDQYQFYPFQGLAGERVRIRVDGSASAGFDPVAALIGPSGDVIAQGDDSEGSLNPHFSADLPADGTYQVRVNGYLSGGSFELTVERLF